VTDEEQASQPGAVATRSDEEPEASAAEQVFTPKDFRLNLGARLVPEKEPLPNLDKPLPDLDTPAIRKLTWEHVVPDRPASSTPSAATTVPLPPPSRVPPPLPPAPVTSLLPPGMVGPPQPVDAPRDVEFEVVEDSVDEELALEDQLAVDEDEDEFVVVDDVADADELAVDAEIDEVALGGPADIVEVDVPPVAAVAPHPVADVPRPVAPQVEINRLSSVPDLVDDDSPIELPPITPSGPIVASPQSAYTPVLAETLYIPPPQRAATTTVPVTAPDRKAKRRKPQRRKKKGHLLRTFMTLVVLFGLLAGGAFAAKKYLLHPVTWSAELKPLADGVATQRGLEFKSSVPVTAVPVADYATRLASSTIDSTTDHAPVWRALGLLHGEFDLESIGRQAMNDSPAFYDPTTKTIYVSDDLKAFEHLYRFSLRRALTAALLDQQFEWGSRLSVTSPAATLGLRATIDGDALAVANALALSDAPDQLAPEFLSFVEGHGTTISPSQYAATITGRPGVVMRSTVTSLANDPVSLATLEQSTPSDDSGLDVGRLAPTAVSAAPMQGMMFWYYVLASRIDDGQAWSAANRWTGDSMTITTVALPSPCVDATFTAVDAEGAAVVLAAFQTWAAAAPVESATQVAPVGTTQIAIRACDPGAVLTAALPARVPVVFGGAGVESALVQSAVSTARNTKVDAVCLVKNARARGGALSSPADDAPVLAVDWQPAYIAANIDIAATCAVAGG
jgi:hypothetical protein